MAGTGSGETVRRMSVLRGFGETAANPHPLETRVAIGRVVDPRDTFVAEEVANFAAREAPAIGRRTQMRPSNNVA